MKNALKRRSRTGLLLVVAGALLATSACSGVFEEQDTLAENQVLRAAITADPRSLWPNSSTAQYELNVSSQISEKLIDFNTDATGYDPVLATEWEFVGENTLRLTLREGVSFTNGEAFNAASSVVSLEALVGAPAYKAYMPELVSIDAVDEYTVEITTKEAANNLLLNALAMGSFQYPKEYWETSGEEGFSEDPIGTGPFKFTQWLKGDTISLERNDEYWGELPQLEKIEFTVITDLAAQVAALQSDQVDFITDIPIGSVETVSGDENLTLLQRPSNRIFSLNLSALSESKIKDEKVRQAFAYAIDVESIIANQLSGYATPLQSQFLGSNYFGFDDSLKAVEYNPERARKMLSEAVPGGDLQITLNYSSGRYPQDKEIGQVIAQQLEKVGITVTQDVFEPGAYLDALKAEKLNDAYLYGLLLPPDAHIVYDFFVNGNYKNYLGDYQDVQALLTKDLSTSDDNERKANMRSISDIFIKRPFMVPLFQGTDLYGIQDNVKGFEPRASQYWAFKNVSIVESK